MALFLTLLSGLAWGQESLPETGEPTESILFANPQEASIPPPASQAMTSTDLFGGRTGYIHPFLSVSSFYTSNLFRTASNELSDRYLVIAPGLWLALPARNQRAPEIGTSNTAPGGLSLSRFTAERERRIQGYAQYQANIIRYDRYEDEDRVDHRAQGMLKFSARGGTSLELVDIFERNSDPYGTGGKADRSLDTFDANLFNAILVSRLSPKLLLRADYSHYTLDYAAASNNYRNRNDDSYSGYLFFQATPKTALFVQGEHIAIDYGENSNLDSRHNNYYLGIQMQTSANTRGRVKVGYGMRDDDTTESNAYLGEAQVDYFFTPKTSIYLQGTRRILETNQIGARSILSHRVLLGYRQRMAARWRIDGNLFFDRNEYDGTVNIGNRIASDYYYDEFGGRATLGFAPRPWVNLGVGYEYRERDSNFNSEDYRSSTIFLRATAAF
ncbi:MAG: outer membrane beta-barrel protein [Desulfuromonadales bacterium]|nr:outer membrane beta-barrel protein [Desulfuromonadales bacterium]